GTGRPGGPASIEGVWCPTLGRLPRLLVPGGASACGPAGGASSQQQPECGRALLRNDSVAERMQLLVPREPDLRRGDVPLLEPHQPLDEPRAQPWLSGPSGLSGSGSIPSGGALPPSDGGSVGSPIR